jgi:UDP-glucose 4-epimerase
VLPQGESVNISTDNCCSVKALLEKIIAHYGYKGEVLLKQARGADVLTHNASNAKVRELISYNLTPFDEGLAATLDWYKTKFEDSK